MILMALARISIVWYSIDLDVPGFLGLGLWLVLTLFLGLVLMLGLLLRWPRLVES